MIKSTFPETAAHKVLVIAKLIFVVSIDDIVIVYVRSSALPELSQAICDIVDAVVATVFISGGFAFVVVVYQVEYTPDLYVHPDTSQ